MAGLKELKESNLILQQQNEQLKSQLMTNALISEISKVMLANTNLHSVFKTMMIGIQETLGFERLILFKMDKENFYLKPFLWLGIEDVKLTNIVIPLTFLEGGEIADSIFLAKHIIVDNPENASSSLGALGSKGYLVIPLLEKVNIKCYVFKNCFQKECPAYESYKSFCWSIQGSGLLGEKKSEDDKRRQCVLCPMFKANYVLWMDKPNKDELVTSDDMTLLTTLANQAGIIIDNFKNYEELERTNRELVSINNEMKTINDELKVAQTRIHRDLDQAKTIQRGLLPTEFPTDSRLKIASAYIPASKVSGDYYDFFKIKDDVYGLIIADVSGHGIAAALIMCIVKILLKTHAQFISSPRETLERLNKIFLTEIKTDNFVTIFYGLANLKDRSVVYSSAGHNRIIFFIDDDEPRYHKADGLFLGVFDDMMLKENMTTYKKRLRFLLYTDGLTEAENSDKEMFELERLDMIARRTINEEPKKVVETLLEELETFVEGRVLEDDVTLLVIDFLNEQPHHLGRGCRGLQNRENGI